MPPEPAQQESGDPADGCGSEQDGGRSIVRFQVLLHHEAAHGMADHYRSSGQAAGNRIDIVNEIRHRTKLHGLGCWAFAMAAKAQSHRPIALFREEVEEMLVPAPGAVPGTVDKEQWNFVRFMGRPLFDHIEHEPDSLWPRPAGWLATTPLRLAFGHPWRGGN